MENKQQNFTRSKACQSTDSTVRKSSSDSQVNKPWPRNTRRCEQPSSSRNDSQRNSKQYPTAKVRPNVDKRPRQRGGGSGNSNASGFIENGLIRAVEGVPATSAGLATATVPVLTGALAKKNYQLNSVYTPGSKKQNLNHLLNFHYTPRECDYAVSFNVFGKGGGSGAASGVQRHGHGGAGKRHCYNKEQFLQANFQFVIKSDVNLSTSASPDTLIDWHLIEQINIQTEEEPQCPICLYPPIAAKLTRCGHAYCWPCILHYLALSDKTWRKCPICFEAIHTAELKSTTILQQRQFNIGDDITFQLMRRKKGCIVVEKFEASSSLNKAENYPLLSCTDQSKLFSKFLIARRNDILEIIDREQIELVTGQDPNCPEYAFIQQALDLLQERREKLQEMTDDTNLEIESETNLTEFGQMPVENENEFDSEVEIARSLEEEHYNGLGGIETNASKADSYADSSDFSLSSAVDGKANSKYYYFYQSVDGQNVYLHPLNIKMLQACYGTLERAPLVITARILQKEYHSMDVEKRRKFTCLGHLPLTCQFEVVEVDLQPPFVTGSILHLFKEDIFTRKKERQRREREERRREKQINDINDRQMGKLIASTANLNLSSAQEFPSWEFMEPLPGVDGVVDVNSTNPTAIPKSKHQASYSTVAVVGETPKTKDYWPTLASPNTHNTNIYQELSSWGKSAQNSSLSQANISNRYINPDRSSDCESVDGFANPMHTDLGDILTIAMSQKKQSDNTTNMGNATVVCGKKSKKTKKMLPLFSTGINYNGK